MSERWDPKNPRRISSVNQMSQNERRAWIEAGKPELYTEPRPKPASPVAMNAEATRAWEAWLYGHLDRLAYEMGACSAEIENCVNAKIRGLEAEIGQLRAAAQVERAANNIVDLPNPLRRRSNAA
jgi:hypothetical protein